MSSEATQFSSFRIKQASLLYFLWVFVLWELYKQLEQENSWQMLWWQILSPWFTLTLLCQKNDLSPIFFLVAGATKLYRKEEEKNPPSKFGGYRRRTYMSSWHNLSALNHLPGLKLLIWDQYNYVAFCLIVCTYIAHGRLSKGRQNGLCMIATAGLAKYLLTVMTSLLSISFFKYLWLI